MQRFQLLVYPDAPRSWRNVDRAPDRQAAQLAHACFARLDNLEPFTRLAYTETDAKPYLRFAPDAQEFFDEWRTALETSLLDNSFEFEALESTSRKVSKFDAKSRSYLSSVRFNER